MTVAGEAESAPPLPTLSLPADGLPRVVDSAETLTETITALAGGHGPIAVDTERAQSFRYSSKAYLIQLRRQGSGTHIIDPVAFEDDAGQPQLSALADVMSPAEWIIHAASQDLPCLIQAGLVAERIFDTELAARLLGLPRVGLGALIESHFGQVLLKEHSAANWSTRPIPKDWLAYAALDVELLIELRAALYEQLIEADKLTWAEQEFAHTLQRSFDPPADPRLRWRRTHGLAQVRTQFGLAVVRELWDERDLLAERYDLAPSKVLPDKAICALAARLNSRPKTADGRGEPPSLPTRAVLRQTDGFNRRTARRFENNWIGALDRVAALASKDLPALKGPPGGSPQPRNWQTREPEAWARWNRVRPATQQLAEQLGMAPENLIQPDALKRITAQPPSPLSEESVSTRLAELGVRGWQIEQVRAVLVAGLS